MASAHPGHIRVEVVAPDKVMWSGLATGISVPAHEGDMGLLPGHESVLALLRPGTVRIQTEGETGNVEVQTGVVSFDDDVATVIVGGHD